MQNPMRKFAAMALAVLMALSTSGCVRSIVEGNSDKHIPNANRSTGHDYDFIDYLTITTWGADKDGYLSVTARDISASDFPSEQAYIDVSEDLKTLGIVYGQPVGNTIQVSKTSGLSNGDIVTISVGDTSNMLRTDINTDAYEYTVSGLGEAKQIDLFSSDIVTMYGTRENALYAYVHNDGKIVPKELTDNLQYSFTTDSETLQAGKTIVKATAALDTKFADGHEYESLTDYLAKHNLQADESKEFVLKEIIDPIDFTAIDSGTLMSAIYDRISADDPSLSRVCSVQQSTNERLDASDYAYMITYYDLVENTPVYYRVRALIHYIDGVFVIPSLDSPQNASRDLMINAVQGYSVCATFVSQEELDALNPAADEPVETPTPEPTEEAQPTPTPTPAPTPSATVDSSNPANSVTQPSSGGSSGGGSGSGGSSGGSTTIEYYSDDPADYPPGTVFTYDENGNLTGVYVPDENGDVLLPDKN